MTKARDLANVEAKATLTDTQTLTNKTLTSPVLGGTTTTASGNLAVQPATYVLEVKGGASTEGAVQLNCAVNTHGQIIKSQPHAQAASNTLLLPGGTTIGNSNAVLVSDTGTQSLTNKTLTSAVLTGTLTAGGSVGTNGQFLQSTGTGVQYATPSSGSMTLLDTLTMSGASVTSSTFSSAYKALKIYVKNFIGSNNSQFDLRMNADTGSNYSWVFYNNGFAAESLSSTALRIFNQTAETSVLRATHAIIDIMRPEDTDQVFLTYTGIHSGPGTFMEQFLGQGIYNSSAAITSITLKNTGAQTMTSGTAFIYGVN